MSGERVSLCAYVYFGGCEYVSVGSRRARAYLIKPGAVSDRHPLLVRFDTIKDSVEIADNIGVHLRARVLFASPFAPNHGACCDGGQLLLRATAMTVVAGVGRRGPLSWSPTGGGRRGANGLSRKKTPHAFASTCSSWTRVARRGGCRRVWATPPPRRRRGGAIRRALVGPREPSLNETVMGHLTLGLAEDIGSTTPPTAAATVTATIDPGQTAAVLLPSPPQHSSERHTERGIFKHTVCTRGASHG